MIYKPESRAISILKRHGLTFEDIYDEKTKSLTPKAAQILRAYDVVLYQNIKKTIMRLRNSEANMAENLKNTIVGTLNTQASEELAKISTKDKPIVVRILPSSSEEQDSHHARFYGKIMTIEAARNIGITKRYGCKCGLEILNQNEKVKGALNDN